MKIKAMFNAAKQAWQNASYKRLTIALALSLLLHFCLIAKFYLHLADFSPAEQVIEARLVLPTPAPAPVVEKPAVKPTAIKKTVPPKPLAKPAPSIAPLPAVEPSTEPTTAPPSEPIDPTPAPQTAVTSVDDSNNNDMIISANVYKFVETTFDVRTEIDAKVNSTAAGTAKMVYQVQPDGAHYHLSSLMEPKGLISLVIPNLLQTSEGAVSNKGLQPTHYLFQYGNKANKTFSADMDWQNKTLKLHSIKGEETLPLADDTQDILSFMYQFMYVAPLQNMKLNITNGKKLGIYDYTFEGEETIASKMGDIKTIHLLRASSEGDEKTELWLALDYQYVPVKIRKTERDNKVYELLVTSLKAELQAQPAP